MRRNYLLASGLCLVLALFIAVPAMAAQRGTGNKVSVVDRHGHRVQSGSQLQSDQRLTITMGGFLARSEVLVQGLRHTSKVLSRGTHIRADSRGNIKFEWTVPSSLDRGTHVLALTGSPPKSKKRTPRG